MILSYLSNIFKYFKTRRQERYLASIYACDDHTTEQSITEEVPRREKRKRDASTILYYKGFSPNLLFQSISPSVAPSKRRHTVCSRVTSAGRPLASAPSFPCEDESNANYAFPALVQQYPPQPESPIIIEGPTYNPSPLSDNHARYPPVCSESLINTVAPPPMYEWEGSYFPRSDLYAYNVSPQLLESLEHCVKIIDKRDQSTVKPQLSDYEKQMNTELRYQLNYVHHLAAMPELALTHADLVYIDIMNWRDPVTKMLLKGAKRVPFPDDEQTLRSSVVRKGFTVKTICQWDGVERKYKMEANVYRLILFFNRIYPAQPGQDVSHLCECWPCLDVENGHLKFEHPFLNTQTRKCHTVTGLRGCKCELTPACIYPKQHPEMMRILKITKSLG